MSPLTRELDRYLTIRRSLGFELQTAERIVRRFVTFAEQQGVNHINTDLFLRWQASFGSAKRETWTHRLRTIRIFTQWLHNLDSKHEVPPQTLIPGRLRRSQPYVYSKEEIRRIVEAAAELFSINGIRPLTFSTLFGLIAVTGVRVSEALALNTSDVDLEIGVLTVRRGKLGKARLLPVCESTVTQLAAYAKERDRLLGRHPEPFFISDHGQRVTEWAARYAFAMICQKLGLRRIQKYFRYGHGPRIHDLGHTFAVRTLINWYRSGKDARREMIKLTTYLGHADPAHTYWYFEAVPELLGLASNRAMVSLTEEVQP